MPEAPLGSVRIDQIKVPEDRQRGEVGDIEALADSIKRIGLINPITVMADLTLVAGFRRLTALRSLGYSHALVRFFEDLDVFQRQALELEENIKRKQLTWQEEASAVNRYHNLRQAQDPEWTQEQSAQELGISRSTLVRHITVGQALDAGHPGIAKVENLSAASRMLDRQLQRQVSSELSQVDFGAGTGSTTKPPPLSVQAAEADRPLIFNCDFREWAKTERSEKFNFLHCDFPYGINHHTSDQGGHDTYETYDDAPEVYWELCTCLADNFDKLLWPSAHIIFWFSMNYYEETVALFEKLGMMVVPQPLIWHKSDNRGILSDPERRPRHIYETALFMSRGDRRIVQAVGNVYSCPTQKVRSLHMSEKPEPMLRHFLRMVVDETTEMLDPTCGAGSAIRAAESLKASRAVGWEINREFALTAETELKRARALRAAAQEVGNGTQA